MAESSCRVCGCTDTFGCFERCHWVEPDLCSVCAGVTPRDRRRHYTRTASAIDPALDVPAGCLAIVSPAGIVMAMTRCIGDAQMVARALDLYLRALNDKARRDLRAPGGPAQMIAREMFTFARTTPVKCWQRGPIARRPRPPLIIGR